MNKFAPFLIMVAVSACADETQLSGTDLTLPPIDFQSTTGAQRILTTVKGCTVTVDTIATEGERNSQIDHRDVFALADVTFRDDGKSPPNYGTTFLPDEPVTESTYISVSYLANSDGAITRTIPVWKEPRDPFEAGPTLNGVDYVVAARDRGGFILQGPDGLQTANAYVGALLAYARENCSATS